MVLGASAQVPSWAQLVGFVYIAKPTHRLLALRAGKPAAQKGYSGLLFGSAFFFFALARAKKTKKPKLGPQTRGAAGLRDCLHKRQAGCAQQQ